jgi:hypothetical protein
VDRDLRTASQDFGGHPLSLTLLASLLKETQNGDVRRRDHIRGLLADPEAALSQVGYEPFEITLRRIV